MGPADPVVELTAPVARTALEASRREGGRLQCAQPLGPDDCRIVDAFLAAHPDVPLRVHARPDAPTPFDLDFLAALPALRHAWIEAPAGTLDDLATLQALPAALESLVLDTVSRYSDRRLDKPKRGTQVWARFGRLADLTVCGRLADLAFLDALPSLGRLELWRNRLSTLAGLERARQVHTLALHASGARDVTPVAELDRLQALEIWDQRGVTGLQALGRLPSLARLWLLSCGRGLPLPPMHDFRALRVLVLHAVADGASVQAVASAPALRCLVLSSSPALNTVEALRPLAGHPSLREVRLDRFDARLAAAIGDAYGWRVGPPNFPADEHLVP